MNKKSVRIKTISVRNNIPVMVRETKSQVICKNVEAIPEFQQSKHTLLYFPHGSEVGILPLIQKYINKRTIYLPRMIGDSQFIALPITDLNLLKRGHYGIPEPALFEGQENYEKKIDCIIVPGVAFDRKGNRLGMGKGFYDRYLPHVKSKCNIGVGFEEQILAEVPFESYDVSVDVVVTELDTHR